MKILKGGILALVISCFLATTLFGQGLVINEVKVLGPGGASDEFIEIFNGTSGAINMDGTNGHRIYYRSATGISDTLVYSFVGTGVTLAAGDYYLLANAAGTFVPVADDTYSNGLAGTGGGLGLYDGTAGTGTLIDSMGYGTATNIYVQGTAATINTATDTMSRCPNGLQTSDNSTEFALYPDTPDVINTCGGANNGDTCVTALTATTCSTLNGDTTSMSNDYDGVECFGSTYYDGADQVWQLVVPSNGNYTITANSTADYIVYIVDDCSGAGTCFGYADNSMSGDEVIANAALTTGTYYIVVAPYSTGDEGAYTLYIDNGCSGPTNTPTGVVNTPTNTPGASTCDYFSEDFEGTFPGANWTLDPGTGDDWLIGDGTDNGPNSVHSGTAAVYFDDYNYTAGTIAHFTTTNTISLGATPHLKFWYWDSSGTDTVVVSISTDGNTYNPVYTTPSTVTSWTELDVDLTSYASQAVYIRFTGTSVYGYSNPHIDDICVYEFTGTVNTPTFTETTGVVNTPTFTETTGVVNTNTPLTLPEINLPADLPYTGTGLTNCGNGNTYGDTCLAGYDGGDDGLYQLNVTAPVTIDIAMDPGATTWTGILISDDLAGGFATCIDSSSFSAANSHVLTSITLAVGTYYILIDTYPTPDCIPAFDLTITAGTVANTPTITNTPVDTNTPAATATMATCAASENFDAVTIPALPTDFTTLFGAANNADTENWVTTDTSANSGANSVYMPYCSTSEVSDSYLVWGPIDMSSMTNPMVQFNERVAYPSYIKTHQLMFSTVNPVSEADFTMAADLNAVQPTTAWTMKTESLAGAASQAQVWIAFHYSGSDGEDWFLDDLCVYDGGGVPNTPVPTNTMAPATNTPDVTNTMALPTNTPALDCSSAIDMNALCGILTPTTYDTANGTDVVDSIDAFYGYEAHPGNEMVFEYVATTYDRVSIEWYYTAEGSFYDNLDVVVLTECAENGNYVSYEYGYESTNNTFQVDLEPGTYYFLFDYEEDETHTFDLTVNCELAPTPTMTNTMGPTNTFTITNTPMDTNTPMPTNTPALDCSSAVALPACGGASANFDTANGASNISGYGCTGFTDYYGNELVFSYDNTTAGTLISGNYTVALSGAEYLDLVVLDGCNENACITNGHVTGYNGTNNFSFTLPEVKTYYFVFDTTSANKTFDLIVLYCGLQLTPTITETPNLTPINTSTPTNTMAPPANDECANATDLSLGVISDPINNGGAMDDQSYWLQTSCVEDFSHNTVWYKWQVPSSADGATVRFDTCNSDFDTTIGLFKVMATATPDMTQTPVAGECGNLMSVGCNEDDESACGTGGQSAVTTTVTDGEVYYLAVGGYYSSIAGTTTGNVRALVWDMSVATHTPIPATPTETMPAGTPTETLTPSEQVSTTTESGKFVLIFIVFAFGLAIFSRRMFE